MNRRASIAARWSVAGSLVLGVGGALVAGAARAEEVTAAETSVVTEATPPVPVTAAPVAVPSPARIAARAAARHVHRPPQGEVEIGTIVPVTPPAAAQPSPVTAASAPVMRPVSKDDSAWAVVQNRAADIAARRTRPSKRLQAVLESRGETEPSADGWWKSTLSAVAAWWPSSTGIATQVARLTGATTPPTGASARRGSSATLVAAAPRAAARPRRSAPETHIVTANVSAPSLMPPAAPAPSHTVRQLAKRGAPPAPPATAPRAIAAHTPAPAKSAPAQTAPQGPPVPKDVATAPAPAALGKRQIPAGAVVATTLAPPRAPLTTREWQQRTGTTRDPFVSLVSGTFEGEESTPVFDVGELRLVGVLWGQTDRFALVENVSGKGTALRPGDRLVNGYVESITPTSLTLVETGLRGSRKIILHMKEDDNGTRTQ